MNMESFVENNRLMYIICIILLFCAICFIAFLVFNDSTKNEIVLPQVSQPLEESFDTKSDKLVNKPSLILYHASWCGYCKMFLPEWEKFQKYAQENLPNLDVKSIVCEGKNENICKQKGVMGYPTVKLYKNQNEMTNGITFEEDRKLEKLVEFVNKNI